MKTTRREFVAVAAGAAAGWLMAGSARGRARAGSYFEWKPVGAGAHAAFGEGGNALVVLGGAGAILVDCKNAPFGGVLAREAEGLGTGGSKITHVVNTHHHGDHTGGNCAFSGLLVAHQNAAPRIGAQFERYTGQIKAGLAQLARSDRAEAAEALQDAKGLAARLDAGELKADMWVPTRTVGEHDEFEAAGHKVVLHHFGSGHTDNDVAVHLPDLDVIHAGDLLFHKMYPYWDPDGGVSGAGWVKSIEKVRDLCGEKTVVVPGHGDLTDRSGLDAAAEVLRRALAAAQAAVKDKRPRDQFVKDTIPGLEGLDRPQLKERLLGGAYDEAAAR